MNKSEENIITSPVSALFDSFSTSNRPRDIPTPIEEPKIIRNPNKSFKLTVIRYEYNSEIPPSKRIVGFRLQNLKNGKTDYLETDVPLDKMDIKTETEILDLAFKNLKHRIDEIKENSVNIIGTEYIPPSES